ncbi:minor capsid protein [Neobacillus cucumis]|uniref:Phage head morphogenesis protein n=1 Tax=Neobacillus cucumis TaxID=1740721 RepID=A0A2N5HES7_9BACI|nr:minor capsid protein [Neobacillus cucumis]PLS04028.1 phage head morphogenesis protein [Neobacillus cucumis]
MAKFEDDFLNLVDSMFNLTDEQHKEIIQAYKGSLDNIQILIAKIFMQYAVDGKLTLADLNKYNRLVSIEQQIKEEIKNLGGIETKHFNTILTEVYKQTYYQTAFTLDTITQAVIDFALLKPEFVKEVVAFNWSGVPFSERIWGKNDALVKALRTELTQGIIQGDSVDKMARRIRKQFNTSVYNSQRLMRTESARVISSAQEKIYQESGVVQELIYTATLDNKTSEICRSHDGKRWKIDDDTRPKIPAHPNCRSCWIPAVKNYQPKVRKDNETKKIIKYKNYKDWSKSKGIK